jgi:DNA-binding transcriptional ArsR family regulator
VDTPGHRELKDRLFEQFARVGKALASPRRLEIVDLLAQGERTVEEIARETSMSVASASQHLQALKAARMALSVYRFWRNLGYAVGVLAAGVISDFFGLFWAIGSVGRSRSRRGSWSRSSFARRRRAGQRAKAARKAGGEEVHHGSQGSE